MERIRYAVVQQGSIQALLGVDSKSQLVLGGKRLELQGRSFVWQHVVLPAGNPYQVLNCQAYKEAAGGATAAGWAGIGIIYYDANWGVIQRFERQIAEYPPGKPGFLSLSLGVRVPGNAVHAIIWAANDDANTRTYIDDLTLHDYLKAGFNAGIGPSLGSTFPGLQQLTTGGFLFASGLQFWELQGCVDTGTGRLGCVGIPSSAAQIVDVVPNVNYIVDCNAFRSFDFPPANFGIDYFDANWKRLRSDFRSLGEPVTFSSTAPAGAAHGVAWIWVAALTSNDQQVPPNNIVIQPELAQ